MYSFVYGWKTENLLFAVWELLTLIRCHAYCVLHSIVVCLFVWFSIYWLWWNGWLNFINVVGKRLVNQRYFWWDDCKAVGGYIESKLRFSVTLKIARGRFLASTGISCLKLEKWMKYLLANRIFYVFPCQTNVKLYARWWAHFANHKVALLLNFTSLRSVWMRIKGSRLWSSPFLISNIITIRGLFQLLLIAATSSVLCKS